MFTPRIIPTLVLLSLLSLVSACAFRKEAAQPEETAPITGRILGYNSLNAQIFTPKCIRCHSGNTPAGGVALDSYNEAFNALDRINNEVVVEKVMPPSGALSNSQQEQIRQWVLAHGPELDITPLLQAGFEEFK